MEHSCAASENIWGNLFQCKGKGTRVNIPVCSSSSVFHQTEHTHLSWSRKALWQSSQYSQWTELHTSELWVPSIFKTFMAETTTKKSHEYCYLILGNKSRMELKRSVNLPVYSFHFPWVVHYLHKYPQSSVKDVVIALQIHSLGERNICILNHHYWVCQRENVCIKSLRDPSAATTTGNIIKLV